jgi:hypothetical protein
MIKSVSAIYTLCKSLKLQHTQSLLVVARSPPVVAMYQLLIKGLLAANNELPLLVYNS